MNLNNPFLIAGYMGPEYFCDREQETADLVEAIENDRNVTLMAPRRQQVAFDPYHASYEKRDSEARRKMYELIADPQFNRLNRLFNDLYLREERPELKPGEPLRGFVPNWMGLFYAHYQWQTGGMSSEIVDAITPEWLCAAYPGLHNLSLELAVEKVKGLKG